jgi:K+-sensing histidine kinase KdpD
MIKKFLSIIETSHNKNLSFHEKLQCILRKVVSCMNTERGSIMLLCGKNTLEVVASTNPELLGIKQPIKEDTPSSWVVKNKRILYVGPGECMLFKKRYDYYKKEAFLLAPIILHDKVIGVLNITDKKDSDFFSSDEQELFLTTAGYVISAVENQRLTESLRKSRNDIKHKNIELKKLERIRTELFNMLIHDLKGPLSEMVANLDILSYTIVDNNLEYVQSAQSACDTLFRMISDLLDITRLEEGCLNLIYEQIEPRNLVHDAVLLLSGTAKAREVGLKEHVSPVEDTYGFPGDRSIMLRVMQNLLINAIQHSPKGSYVETGFKNTDENISFFIKDNGPGILPEFQEAIFNKFFQITKKSDGRRYSTGLGLTFCKMAVEAHSGSIRVESDGVKGSRFVFTIPMLKIDIK